MTFAAKLKAERVRLGLSQSGAEALLDLGKGQVTAWETERNTPHVLTQEGTLARLAKIKTPKP
jgi:transcriptional regulator with XRE-family HTH domain